MSTGDAIVISTLLVIAAASTWQISVAHRWGTVGKICGFIILLIILIIGGFNAYEWYQKRPKATQSLTGIRVGMNDAEVIVVMGKPNSVSEEKTYKILSYTRDYDPDYSFTVSVSKKENKVDVVCERGEFSDPYLNKYNSEAELIERFGTPKNSVVDRDGNYKSLSYPEYNMTFIVRAGRLSEACLSDKAAGYLA